MDTFIYAVQFPILVTNFWTWASIVGLSMTPNLVLGPSAAVGVGISAHYNPWVLVPVVAVAGYFEGLVLAWLAGESTRIGFINRWVARMRTPRGVAIANKWGVWGGLSLGCALVGQEPILVALRWLGVDMRRIWLPLAISNAVFAVLYYVGFPELPIVMTLATLLRVIGDFKSDAIGVGEAGCPIVRGVYGIEFCIGCCYASPAKLSGYGCDVCRCIDTKAEVVQSG